MAFKKSWKCEDCDNIQWSFGEPSSCENENCNSHRYVNCLNCNHLRYTSVMSYKCNLQEEPYNEKFTDENDLYKISILCDDFKHN